MRVEKAYFKSPRNATIFNRGGLILFYISGSSGGSKELIGCGRITYSDVISINKVNLLLERQGVIPYEKLEQLSDKNKRIHAFTFDNYNEFQTKIPFGYLKDNKFISGANLVTSEKISSSNLQKIFNYGLSMKENTHV